MGKHTPGPWSVPHFARPEVNCQCSYVLTDGYMGAVCSVYASGDGDWAKTGDNPKFDEAVANAHLIAAAPDLYNALAALVSHYTALVNSGDAGNWDPETDLPVKAARAALAKAGA